MMTIRYLAELDLHTPAAVSYGKIAKMLYNMAVVSPDENDIPEENTYMSTVCVPEQKARDMVPIKELCALIAIEAGQQAMDESVFITQAVWPYEMDTVLQSVKTSSFMNALFEYGLDAVKISPLRLLQLAAKVASKHESDTIEDEHVYQAACAYYCSFDERFQAIFYPSSYCLGLASAGAGQFELSSALARGMSLTRITNITPTSLWLTMLVQEPVPSLLYDFLVKTKQNTGVREDVTGGVDEIEVKSVADMIHYYVNMLFPSGDMSSATFSDNFMLMVSDVVVDTPASVKDIVACLMRNQNKSQEEIEHWLDYCAVAESSCDVVDSPIAYYPNFSVLSSEGIEAVCSLLADKNAPIRRLLASAAFASFLDESLEGGAPDLVRLYKNELALGAHLIDYNTDVFGRCDISDEDVSVLMMSRKLAHFGVPALFQQLILANMVSRKSAIVSAADIIAITSPQSGNGMMLLSNDVSPASAHAGVSLEAARILSITSAVMQRVSLTIPMDELSSARLYASLLATAVATWQTDKDSSCADIDQWLLSVSSAPFDPRIHVFYSPTGAPAPTGFSTTITEFPLGNIQQSAGALAQFGTDMVALAKTGKIGEGIVGRDETISLVETVLARRDKSNPLLLAPAGAGKSAIVEAIAAKIANQQTTLLNGCGLYSLDLTSLIADGCSAGIMAERLEQIVQEAISCNTILFIDEIHMISSIGSGEMNVGNILKPYLARDGLKLIGATTEREYNYTIAKDKALARRFSTMHLPALSFEAIMDILKEKQRFYSTYHGVAYTDKSARSIALLAKDYMSDKESPDRELDVLDTAAAVAARAKSSVVEEQHIVEAVRLLTSNRSVKTRAEIARELTAGDLDHAALDEMFPRVAGQYRAKKAIARKISESKLDISARPKPKNIFMFVGESGVGKTYMAHEMASLLDADESDVLTLNLGEYQDRAAHTRLVGAAPQYIGYQEGGVLTNFVKAHPHGIVVLDEFDKADPSISQLFLGVFDAGILRAGDGSVADCHSITFVCTANTGHGAEKKHSLGFSSVAQQQKEEDDNVVVALKAQFGDPLINRIDEVVIFDELTADDFVEICRLSYNTLAAKLMERHGVDLADAYTEEQLLADVKNKLEKEGVSSKDARTVWSSFERNIIPKAIALLG